MKEELFVSQLRSEVCRRVITAASKNDVWDMKRYAAINSYLFLVDQKLRK